MEGWQALRIHLYYVGHLETSVLFFITSYKLLVKHSATELNNSQSHWKLIAADLLKSIRE